MPVPETAVNEHNRPISGKGDIGFPEQIRTMEAETEAGPVKSSPDRQLGRGIPRPNPCHHCASLWVYSDGFDHLRKALSLATLGTADALLSLARYRQLAKYRST